MPTTTVKDVPIVLTVEPGTPEYKVVDNLRKTFGTTGKGGRFRRADAKGFLTGIISNILLNASATTLEALAIEIVEKKGVGGKDPVVKVKEVLESIVEARSGTAAEAVDLTKLSDEELAAELERRKAAKSAPK